jgi:DNA-binding response OmpR family regulator
MKILLVDDDPELLDLLAYALAREGYAVVGARDGEQALRRWEAEQPEVVVLDVALPRLDGFEVCRRRRQRVPTPVILLTARDAEADILRGFQAGADDYVTKPFCPKQLAARLQALLRRTQPDPAWRPGREVRVGDLVLDLQAHEATRHGTRVPLTPLEFRLLRLLAVNAGRVLPYARLLEDAWEGDGGGDLSLLKTHVSHLRRKLRLPPGALVAVPGVGYRLAPWS